MSSRAMKVGAGGLVVGFVMGVWAVAMMRNGENSAYALAGEPMPVAAAPPPMEAGYAEAAPPQMQKRKTLNSFGSKGLGGRGTGPGGGGMAAPTAAPSMAMDAMREESIEQESDDSKDDGDGAAAPTRAWFPETFLFEPLVVTDASGAATVPVRVPDRLTQWRVLALAHSRSGAQAGAVTSFAGTLPTYVDPVLPPFLRAGDTVRLPVQVVNTTDKEVVAALKVDVRGAQVEDGARTVKVPARGSAVAMVTVRAQGAGPVTVRASLGDTDAVVRDFDVWATGQPVVQTRGGSLGAPRTLSLVGPADAQSGSERVRLQVYPGALEIGRASCRERVL